MKVTEVKDNYVKRIAYLGVCIAVAMICSYIETLIPFFFGVPGMKLGLTNFVILFVLYTVGMRDAVAVSVIRVFLVGVLFGNAFSILYSLVGGILSLLVMWMLKRLGRFKMISVSAAGGIAHNLGQIIVAMILVKNYNVMYYFPFLMICGLLTGVLIGVIAQEMVIRIPESLWKSR